MVRVVVLSLLLVGASTADAQTADDDEAHSLYDAGRHAFESGRYDRALEDFQRAYALSPRPELLYNIGQTADRLRHDAEALDAFERYLASPSVDASLRPQIEGRVAVLRAAVAEHREAPIVSAPAPAPASSGDPTAGIALLVTGGVLAVAGVVLLVVASTENAAVQGAGQGTAWADAAGHLDAANGLAIGGGVALGLGAIGCVAGAIVLATSSASSSTATAVSFGPGSVAVRGTF